MPKEYVYKILLDDTDAEKTLQAIDIRIQNLAKAADGHFANVGRGMGTGLRQATAHVQQASQTVQRTEQQTTQQVRQSQQQIAREAQQTSQQRVRAAQQTARAETGAARQISQSKRQAIQQANQELRLAKEVRDSANRTARTQVEAAENASRAQVQAVEEQIRAQQRLAEAREGADIREVGPALSGAEAAGARVAETTTVAGQEQVALQQATEAAQEANQVYEQAAQRRQELGDISVDAAQRQAQAEAILSDATRQRLQESISGYQAELNQAKQVQAEKQQALVQAKAEVEAAKLRKEAAQDTHRAQRDAAEESQDAVEEAQTAEKAAIDELKAAKDSGVQDDIQNAERVAGLAEHRVELAEKERDVQVKAKRDTRNAIEEEQKTINQASRDRTKAQQDITKANADVKTSEDRLKKSKNALTVAEKNAVKSTRDANREFIKTTKTYRDQRNALNALAQRYGAFNVTIGKSREEMNELEREVDDVVRSNKQLSDSIDTIVQKRGQFRLGVDRGTFAGGPQGGIPSSRLRQAGFAAQRVGIPGAAAIGEAAAVGGIAGVAIAGTILVTKELVQTLYGVSKAAAEAFLEIVNGAVEAAREIEVADAQFTAFFEGDTRAAEAALQRLRDLSVELGENVVGIGRAFLPEVEDLDQLEEVVKIATALSRFQPEQGALGARIALQEALAGEFRSLQRRFEISPVAIDKIRAAFETAGVTGLLEELQAELERTGRSVDDLGDTFGVYLGRVRERINQLKIEMGEPIVAELGEQFDALDEALDAVEPDLTAIATGLGFIVERLLEMLGLEVEKFLDTFDPTSLLAVVDALYGAVEAFSIFIEGMSGGELAAQGLEGGLWSLAGVLGEVERFFIKGAIAAALMRETILSIGPVLDWAISNVLPIFLGPFAGPIAGPVSTLVAPVGADVIRSLADAGSSVEDLREQLAASEARQVEFALRMQEITDGLSDFNEEGEEAANTFMTIGQGMDQLIVTQQDYQALQEKVNETVKEFDIAATLRFEKLLTDASRRRQKAEIENAQKLIDIDRKNKQKISDLRGKFEQDVVKAAQTLGDKETDIARKHGRSILDLEEELNDQRLEVEEDYQEDLEKLRDKFNFDAFEAILANDGKRLRQIRRRQAFEETQLKKNRENEKGDLEKDGKDRRAELEKQLARELQDASIANARKIRDLAQGLTASLAKQEEARRREVEKQAIAEKRKQADLKESLNQQLQDYQDWWVERNRVTQDKVAEDLATMQQYITDAMEIMRQLSSMGIIFNPLTGQPEIAFSQPEIETVAPGTKKLIDQVTFLTQAQQFAETGEFEPTADIREELAQASISDLIKGLERLQRQLDITPGEEDFISTATLGRELLLEQAEFLGAQVGMSAQKIVDETFGMSMSRLQEWIDDFIAKYQPADLPDFSIFGLTPEDILGQGGPMSMVTPGTPGAPFMFPPGPMSQLLPGAQQEGMQFQGGMPFTGQTFPAPPPRPVEDPEDLPSGVPTAAGVFGGGLFDPTGFQAEPGETTFVFPGVTDAPYVTPAGTGVGGTATFGQAITAQPGQIPNLFQPGNIMPVNPMTGFNLEQWEANTQAQIDLQIAAEMVKRGEIEDTTAFAELLAEEEVLAITSMLGNEVDQYQIASDEEIAILEQTLARQQATLARLREDPGLEEEAKVVEQSIGIIQSLLEKKREEVAAANQAILDQETAAQIVAESEKQTAIEGTLDTATQAAVNKAVSLALGLDEEVASTDAAEGEKTQLLTDSLTDQSMLSSEFRTGELEADAEAQDERTEITADSYEGLVDIIMSFWRNWIIQNSQGINADLRQLAQWLKERQRLYTIALTFGPGGGTLGLPQEEEEPTEGPADSPVATEAELENLAIAKAEELGLLTPVMLQDIMAMTYGELVDFVQWLQNQLGVKALGGGIIPGQPQLVGEHGPEILSAAGVGRIDTFNNLLFRNSLPFGGGGTTNIDQSMNMGGITFPDPRGLPPTYIREMENIALRVSKRGWSGR